MRGEVDEALGDGRSGDGRSGGARRAVARRCVLPRSAIAGGELLGGITCQRLRGSTARRLGGGRRRGALARVSRRRAGSWTSGARRREPEAHQRDGSAGADQLGVTPGSEDCTDHTQLSSKTVESNRLSALSQIAKRISMISPGVTLPLIVNQPVPPPCAPA